MNLNRAKTFAIAIATAGALMLVPSAASAAQLSGKTNQPGQSITLKTRADGSVKFAQITWKTKCRNGAKPIGTTTFRNPQRSTPTGFKTGGKDVDKKGKYTYIFRSNITGNAKGSGFAGIFKSRVKVERKGEGITTCKTGKIRWSAS